jgi:hypothetical protein
MTMSWSCMLRRLLALATWSAALAAQNPADGEVPLPAATGWRAFSIHDSDAGVWYAQIDKVVDAYGQNEVIATDDRGRWLLLTVYSGKWTAHQVNPDGQWLAPSRSTDLDPRAPGRELYAAGLGGSVHRITLEPEPHGRFRLRSVEIGHAAGEEFHTVLAGDLTPERAGGELLVFGITGAVYELVPQGDAGEQFAMPLRARLSGRVRDAVVLPDPGGTPTIVGASRSGELLAMSLRGERLESRVLLRASSGLGRVARAAPAAGRGADHGEVLYVTRDDGVLLRAEQQDDGSWRSAVIFAGAQGLRGVAAGRFDADPDCETVAVYGYGKEVQLVSRRLDGPWQVETIFAGVHQGHWLAVGELDGRNGTDELVATGFGGQVVLLARPPGYALPEAAVPEALRDRPQRAVAADR